jgi:hypothetical protein
VLTATSSTAATWQTPSGGGGITPLQATKTDTETYAVSDWADIPGMSLTYTATSTTQKITVRAMMFTGNASTAVAQFRFVNEDGTLITADSPGSRLGSHGYGYVGNATFLYNVSMELVFTPGTTSARTYKVQWYRNGTGSIFLNRSATDTNSSGFSRTVSTFILQPH